MSSVIPKQPKREREQITIKLEKDLLRKLEHYGRYLESSRDYIISAALELIFRRDKSFATWLEERSGGRGEVAVPKPAPEGDAHGSTRRVRPIATPTGGTAA